MLRYEHLFWDFDGTLYNSYPQIVRALENTLRDFQVPEALWENNLDLLKASVFSALSAYEHTCGLPQDQLLERFHYHHSQEDFFPPYDGLQACLTDLLKEGASHYLYTHRDARAWMHLERDGLRELFADGVTSEDGFPYKPAPEALLAMMHRHGLDPSRCAMIGDRDIDIQSGRNAGIAGILFDPEGFYPHLEADGRVRSMKELYTWLHTAV